MQDVWEMQEVKIIDVGDGEGFEEVMAKAVLEAANT